MNSMTHDTGFECARQVLAVFHMVMEIDEYEKVFPVVYHVIIEALEEHEKKLAHRNERLNPSLN